MKKKTALTIAGSDSSGGAGIQADLKTMHGCGVYGMSAITAITAQNTTGVKSIQKVSPEVLGDQLDMVFSDIYPDAVKVGMTFDSDLIEVIADRLHFYKAKRIVLDPVMVATSGAKLLEDAAIEALQNKLMPMADLLTPNIPEAEVLLGGRRIETNKDMEDGAKEISERFGCSVLIKGGHMLSCDHSSDVLKTTKGGIRWFESKRVDNPNTHGTGCTLSSAIASFLALGHSLEESISMAKDYLFRSIKEDLDLGKGHGPLWHIFYK
jgi:hydroxymethylpyrimidine kinase/phosphomethylpyrimidine kinase